jgi:hypothetical protein
MRDDEIAPEEDNVYSPEGREEIMEDDGITPLEEGFMEGAEGGGQEAKCRFCGEPLGDKEDVVEREIDGSIERFCSDDHAEKYIKEKSEE